MGDNSFREVLAKCSRQDLCLQCMRTVELCVGKQAKPYSASKSEMISFIQDVFGDDVQAECMRERNTDREDEARFQLHVTVTQAEDTPYAPKANTFCRLWIEEEHAKAQQSPKRKWNWETALVYSVKMRDPSSSTLLLEIWQRPSANLWTSLMSLYRPDSFSGFFRSLRQLMTGYFAAGTDTFVGRVEKRVQDIPCLGTEHWYALRDTKGHELNGGVKLSVSFRTETSADFSVLQSLKDHYALSYVFLEHNVDKSAEVKVARWKKWQDCVDKEGLTLLRQHALQNSLQDVEAHYCYLLAVTEHRMKVNTQISFAVMHTLLLELRAELDSKTHHFVREALEQLTSCLSDHINLQLSNMHSQFYLEYELHALDLSGALSVCALMELMKPTEVITPALQALQENERNWYDSMTENWDHYTSLDAIARVLDKIRVHHSQANVLFEEAWNETYSSIVMHDLDHFFAMRIYPRVRQLVTDVQTAQDDKEKFVVLSMETFQVLKSFLEELFPALKYRVGDLQLSRYREWFGAKVVSEWFSLSSQGTDAIRGFLEDDNLLPLNANVKYSSSFVETVDAITEKVVQLWVMLDWPDYTCAHAFVNSIEEWTTAYAVMTEKKIDAEWRLNDEVVAVPASLCVAINNLTATEFYVSKIRCQIIESFVGASDDVGRFHGVDAKILNAIASITASKTRISDKVLLKIVPNIGNRMDTILRATSTVTQEVHVEEMLKHVTACVTSLSLNLEAAAFEAILNSFWTKLVALLRQLVARLRASVEAAERRVHSIPYLGMSVVLQQLPRCFAMKHATTTTGDVEELQLELRRVFQVPKGATDF